MTASWRTLGKRTLALPWRLGRPFRRVPTRWILTYHEIGDHPWATSPEGFRRQLDALRGAAQVIPLADLCASPADGPGLRVAITFDDGYLGVARHAVPALEEAGVRATVFLPTDLLAEEDGPPSSDRGLYADVLLLGWTTVRRLAARGTLAFESHGAAHVALPALSDADRRDDLHRSRERLARETGRAPRYLAYPFGAADDASAASAREAGFEAAFTTRHGGLRADADPHRLPRVDVRGDYEPRDLLSILRGRWDFLAAVQRARAGRA